jgi:hypothetical protein
MVLVSLFGRPIIGSCPPVVGGREEPPPKSGVLVQSHMSTVTRSGARVHLV